MKKIILVIAMAATLAVAEKVITRTVVMQSESGTQIRVFYVDNYQRGFVTQTFSVTNAAQMTVDEMIQAVKSTIE